MKEIIKKLVASNHPADWLIAYEYIKKEYGNFGDHRSTRKGEPYLYIVNGYLFKAILNEGFGYTTLKTGDNGSFLTIKIPDYE